MRKRLYRLIGLGISGTLVSVAQPVWAQLESVNEPSEPGVAESREQAIAEVSELNLEQPVTTVTDWFDQLEQYNAATVDPIQITQAIAQVVDVQVNPTETGMDISLTTVDGQLAAPEIQVIGNVLIADIANTTLALPEGGEFQQANPANGIALVTVTPREDGIRVAITGTDAPPTAEVRSATPGLVLSVTSGTGEAAATEDEAIQVVVTATRTEEELQNVPRSVTVITREQIEDQTRLDRNLGDILARLVPGFGPPTGRTNTFGQTLRGRDISVLIDGVPQNTNLGSIPAQLTTIDPQAIERIEVVRGPNAIYGGQATGGVVNIITRRPTEDQLQQTVEIGASAAAGGGNQVFLTGDSFSYNFLYSVSGRSGAVDWLSSLSFVPTGSFYDADGDRIPSDLVNADLNEINGLVRLGVDLYQFKQRSMQIGHPG
jgi:iron complex outermembrane receptor protein